MGEREIWLDEIDIVDIGITLVTTVIIIVLSILPLFIGNDILTLAIYDGSRTIFFLSELMGFFTDFVLVMIFVIVSFDIIYFRKNLQRISIVILLDILATYAIVLIIKSFFFVPRPYAKFHLHPFATPFTDSSFPSAHTAVGFSLATTLDYAESKIRYLGWGIAYLIGISRVITGLHYVLDVIVGALIGIFLTLITYFIIHKFLCYQIAKKKF